MCGFLSVFGGKLRLFWVIMDLMGCQGLKQTTYTCVFSFSFLFLGDLVAISTMDTETAIPTTEIAATM